MAKPEIHFADSEQELQYGVKVLVESGFSAQQIERIRDKGGVGPGKIPYDKETVGQRRYMVQELLAARLSNRQIANVLKLSKETVAADRNFNRQLWAQEIIKSQDVHRARILQEQMELKDMAMKSFEKSKKKRTVTMNENGGDEEGSSIIKIEESAGESSFLTVAKGCLEQQARILGLHDIKPQVEEKKSYKGFLDDLAKTINDVKDNEEKAKAVDAKFTVEDEKEEDQAINVLPPGFEP